MASITHIDKQTAIRMLGEVQQAHQDAMRLLSEIDSLQQDLVAKGWHGNSADDYRARSDQQNADFQDVSNTLDQTATQGESDLQAFINAS